MNEIEKMIKTVGGSVDEYRHLLEKTEIAKTKSQETVEITVGALDNMIDYMDELIYQHKDENADLATHPFEVGFLDYLISVRDKQRNKGDKNEQNKKTK